MSSTEHSLKIETVRWLCLPAVCMIYAAIPPFTWWHNTIACMSEIFILAFLAFRGYLSGRSLGTALFFIAGFLFSVAGDYFMGIRGNDHLLFIAAIGLFFLAHVSFLVGFLVNGRPTKYTALFAIALLIGYLPYYLFQLMPVIASPVLNSAVLVYLLVSVFSLAGSTCICYPWKIRLVAIAGICMIVFSDTLIAERIFAHNSRLAFLIIPTYVATHFLLTAAVVLNALYGRVSPAILQTAE